MLMPKNFSLVFVGLLVALPALAAPSWTSSPSWKAEPEYLSDSARRGQSRTSQRTKDVSPFSPESHNISLDVGQVFLMGDLSERYNDNIGFRINYTYGVSDLFGFNAIFGYSEHADGKFSMTDLMAGLRTNLAYFDKVIPYFNFGLGFYRPSYSFDSGAGSNATSLSPVLFGLHMGGGVTLEISKDFFFGSSLTFHNVFGDTRQTAVGPFDVGGAFTTFMLNAGMTL